MKSYRDRVAAELGEVLIEFSIATTGGERDPESSFDNAPEDVKEQLRETSDRIMAAGLPFPRWEALHIGLGPPHAGSITLRAYGPLAVGKSRLLKDIAEALAAHPRWKGRGLLLDTVGSDER